MLDKPLSRRRFLQRSTATGGVLAALSEEQGTRPETQVEQQPAGGRRPNILFIMTDQQRFDCLGANGNSIIRTPHLDRFAQRSANMQQAFVQSPVCVPSRGCFFTGLYAHSHRNRVNYTPMPAGEVFLQRYLRDAGYETASVGKLHLYPPTVAEAKRTGFQRVLLHDGVGRTDPYSDYVKWRDEKDPKRDTPYRAYAANVEPGKNPYRASIDDEFTDTSWCGLKTREMLVSLARGDRPFFLYSSFWKPHSPYEVPVPFDSMYDHVEIPLPRRVTLDEIRRLPPPLQKQILRFQPKYDMDRTELEWIYRSYYASVSHIDREIGLILDTLEEVGRADDTIVVFASDHGDQLLEHGLLEKNVLFEGSIHVPFLLSFPGRIRPGTFNELVESVDLIPTLFELVELDEPYWCQGRSFASLLTSQESGYIPKDAVFAENVIPEVITSDRNMTYRFSKDEGVAGIRHPDAKMIRTRTWKLNYYPEGYGELYHLADDPGELHNLFTDPARQNTVAELKERLLHWLITADETRQIAEKWLL